MVSLYLAPKPDFRTLRGQCCHRQPCSDSVETFPESFSNLPACFDVPWIYLPSTLPLFCIYQKAKKFTFSTIMDFELCQLWIMNCNSSSNLPPCYLLTTFLLPSCYPLATFLLSSCYPLTIPLLQFLFSTFTELPQHIANI